VGLPAAPWPYSAEGLTADPDTLTCVRQFLGPATGFSTSPAANEVVAISGLSSITSPTPWRSQREQCSSWTKPRLYPV
jgi:hypothetical protein